MRWQWRGRLPGAERQERLFDYFAQSGMDVQHPGGELVGGVSDAHRLKEGLDEDRRLGPDDVGAQDLSGGQRMACIAQVDAGKK